MRSRRCNNCSQWSPIHDWAYGCPACGFSNALGDFVQASEFPGVEVMPDIKPYKNMIDGKEISSRSKHRQFLKDNHVVEIGNETKYLAPRARQDIDPRQRKELIVAQVQAFGGHENLKKVIKREIDHIRWNSRKD